MKLKHESMLKIQLEKQFKLHFSTIHSFTKQQSCSRTVIGIPACFCTEVYNDVKSRHTDEARREK